jgi:hypothetical protein
VITGVRGQKVSGMRSLAVEIPCLEGIIFHSIPSLGDMDFTGSDPHQLVEI